MRSTLALAFAFALTFAAACWPPADRPEQDVPFACYDHSEDHVDFGPRLPIRLEKGLVADALGDLPLLPVYVALPEDTVTTHGAAAFDSWWCPPGGTDRLDLLEDAELGYFRDVWRFSDFAFYPFSGDCNRFWCPKNRYHACEAHLPVVWDGQAALGFASDDDLWVFVNGRLAVDLGGVHPAWPGRVDLAANAAAWGLALNETFHVDLYYADRRPYGAVLYAEFPALARPLQEGGFANPGFEFGMFGWTRSACQDCVLGRADGDTYAYCAGAGAELMTSATYLGAEAGCLSLEVLYGGESGATACAWPEGAAPECADLPATPAEGAWGAARFAGPFHPGQAAFVSLRTLGGAPFAASEVRQGTECPALHGSVEICASSYEHGEPYGWPGVAFVVSELGGTPFSGGCTTDATGCCTVEGLPLAPGGSAVYYYADVVQETLPEGYRTNTFTPLFPVSEEHPDFSLDCELVYFLDDCLGGDGDFEQPGDLDAWAVSGAYLVDESDPGEGVRSLCLVDLESAETFGIERYDADGFCSACRELRYLYRCDAGMDVQIVYEFAFYKDGGWVEETFSGTAAACDGTWVSVEFDGFAVAHPEDWARLDLSINGLVASGSGSFCYDAVRMVATECPRDDCLGGDGDFEQPGDLAYWSSSDVFASRHEGGAPEGDWWYEVGYSPSGFAEYRPPSGWCDDAECGRTLGFWRRCDAGSIASVNVYPVGGPELFAWDSVCSGAWERVEVDLEFAPGATFAEYPGAHLELDFSGAFGLDGVTLLPTECVDCAGFAPYVPGTYLNSIGDRVWLDADRNGIQEASEPGIEGALVCLYLDSDSSGTPTPPDAELGCLETDSDGRYVFEGMASPAYYLVRVEPCNFSAGGALEGMELASGYVLNPRLVYLIGPSQEVVYVDFGFAPASP